VGKIRNKLIVLTLMALSDVAHAGDGSLTLTVENDVFTNSDNNYTNGVGVSWVSGAVDTQDDGFLGQWTRI